MEPRAHGHANNAGPNKIDFELDFTFANADMPIKCKPSVLCAQLAEERVVVIVNRATHELLLLETC